MKQRKNKKKRMMRIDVVNTKKRKSNKIEFMKPLRYKNTGIANSFGIKTPDIRRPKSKKIFQMENFSNTKKPRSFTSNLYRAIPNNNVHPYLLSNSKNNPFKISTKGIRKKDMRWNHTLGDPKYRNLNPFADTDKDGVLNILDCRPFDPSRQEDINVGSPSVVPSSARKKKKKIYKDITSEEFDTPSYEEKMAAKRKAKEEEEEAIRKEKEKLAAIEEATSGFVERKTKSAREQALDTEWQIEAFDNRQ